jgi:hypothetical protein
MGTRGYSRCSCQRKMVETVSPAEIYYALFVKRSLPACLFRNLPDAEAWNHTVYADIPDAQIDLRPIRCRLTELTASAPSADDATIRTIALWPRAQWSSFLTGRRGHARSDSVPRRNTARVLFCQRRTIPRSRGGGVRALQIAARGAPLAGRRNLDRRGCTLGPAAPIRASETALVVHLRSPA